MKLRVLLLSCLFLLLYLFRPTTAITLSSFEGVAMTIPYKIQLGQQLTDLEKRKIEKVIESTFSETFHIYNNWNPHSELSLINATKSSTTLSAKLYTLLEKTEQMVQQSEGAFDPTITPSGIGCWKEIKLTTSSIQLPKDCLIDLGGIAKGYTVDLLVERLQALGFQHLLVEWGGDFRAAGSHPQGRPWQVQLMSPHKNSEEEALFSLDNIAIATSGDYLQYTATEHGLVSHIWNPKTGNHLPVQTGRIASATVEAKTCLEADAMATALMCCTTPEEVEAWKKKQTQLTSFVLFRQKELHTP